MQYIPDHYKNYSKYVREGIYNRKQQFDRWSQLYSVTENVELGQKLPAYVKFPCLSKELDEDLPKEHLWAQHRLGKYNGLYFIPLEEFSTNDPLRHVIISSKYKNGEEQNVDISKMFFETAYYQIIALGLKSIYLKLNTQDVPGTILLRNEDMNISDQPVQNGNGQQKTYGEAVEELSKFNFRSNIPYVFFLCNILFIFIFTLFQN